MRLYSKLLGLALALGIAAASAQSMGPPSSGGGAPTGAAGGGLSGTYPNPTVATNANLTGDVTSVGNATSYANVVPAAKGGAGTITGALKGSGAGVVTQAACADLSNGSGACAQTYTATTWTPTLSATGTAGTPTYVIQVGSYEQIGRQVTVRFVISISAWAGTPTGNVVIAGLPVASASTTNDFGSCTVGQFTVTTLTGASLSGYVTPGSSTIVVQQGGATGSGFVSPTQAGTGFQIIGACFYHT